jgi:hypothetical protein
MHRYGLAELPSTLCSCVLLINISTYYYIHFTLPLHFYIEIVTLVAGVIRNTILRKGYRVLRMAQ